MRRWQSHKIVEAEIMHRTNTASWVEVGEDPVERIEVPGDFFARGMPVMGDDYLVRYADGYLSWSPKKAFEEGYTVIDGVP